MLAEADQTPASETSPAIGIVRYVKLPSRQDAHPQAPWRHNEGGAKAIGIVTHPAGCEYLSLD
jgi:hypothetical protein